LRRVLEALIYLSLAVAPTARADLPPSLAAALVAAGIPDSQIGVVIQDLTAETPLLAHGEKRAFNPASVMKLLTTLAALDMLGPAHTWQTEVLVDGEIRDGRLAGNLILRGGGDPGLTLERFWLLLREIRSRGIRHIQGDVILDNSHYAIDPVDPGAFDQAPLRPYNAQPAALLVNHNALALRLAARQDGLDAWLDPPVLNLELNAKPVPDGPCGDWQDVMRFQHGNGTLRIEGAYPAACGERQTWLNLFNPEDNAAAVFANLWRESGGGLDGIVRPGRAPAEARPLLSFPSSPLGRLVMDTNEYSNNVMAKMLFLNLGAHRLGAPATWQKGESAIRAWLLDNRLCLPELVLENGSGLSRAERISAESLARLLRFAASRPVFADYLASLPILGREGTLRTRLSDSPHAGRAWLKTGSLNGARNLAGFVMDDQGVMKVFVLLINHAQASAGARAQDSLLDWTMHPPTVPSGPPPGQSQP
jgi:D-alanyl-D-alanine carboxypeptidase/D-alanyl-D-alanine-endopeptidase (penicillin-binding protein 4)